MKHLKNTGRASLNRLKKPLEEMVCMKLYSGRLIQKLEKKMHDPERSEAKYRSVVEAVDALVCLIDRENRFFACNKKSLERFGLTPEGVVGRTISEIITDPDDAEFCTQMVRKPINPIGDKGDRGICQENRRSSWWMTGELTDFS